MIARTTRWASACLPLLTAIAALAGCDESPTTIQRSLAPSPGRMVIISGDGQSAPAGTELPQPLVVRVLDGAGEPIEGQIVNFRVTAGGGSVLTGASTTGADGATEDRWTLGTAGTAQEIEARAVDAATGTRQVFATFTATAIDPATIVASVVVSPAEADLTVGGTQQLNAVARNAAGGAVPGKTFEWSSSNTAVATVSATGLVTAHAPGTVTVSAAADELSGSASLEVAPEPEVDTDPPGTPGIPTVAFPSQTSDSVTVTATWTAAADGAAYRWSAGSNAGGFERIGESTGTSATFRVPLSAEADGYWVLRPGGGRRRERGRRAGLQHLQYAG